MSNIVFKSTIQFLKFVNEKIIEKERLFGNKNYAFEYIYLDQRQVPISLNK